MRLLCPVHNDHEPSLDVCEGEDGVVLAICRSRGCKYGEICEAMGYHRDSLCRRFVDAAGLEAISGVAS